MSTLHHICTSAVARIARSQPSRLVPLVPVFSPCKSSKGELKGNLPILTIRDFRDGNCLSAKKLVPIANFSMTRHAPARVLCTMTCLLAMICAPAAAEVRPLPLPPGALTSSVYQLSVDGVEIPVAIEQRASRPVESASFQFSGKAE